MDLRIRKADLADADIVGTISARSWQVAYRGIVPDEYLEKITPEYRAERFRTVLPLLPDAEFYLVQEGKLPIGVFNAHTCRDENTGDCGEIGIFYFLPEYWGKGYAAPAMQFALDRLKERDYQSVVLWVFEENLRARRFYEKQGFVADGMSKILTLGKDLVEIRYRQPLGKADL